jgi:hypothetical protein
VRRHVRGRVWVRGVLDALDGGDELGDLVVVLVVVAFVLGELGGFLDGERLDV